jgi:L-ascorbate metabolism protein UlaG (beta-lactamase superfamily)
MEITWYGLSCFRLMERGKAAVVTDPYNGGLGYQFPKLRADIVTISHEATGHANRAIWPPSTHILDRPGEYEIGGVFVIGVAMHNPEQPERPNVVYLFDFDGINVLHLGDLDHVPVQADIDAFGTVNVALVPIGGGKSLNAAQAAEVISLIEPEIVIPMHYQTPGCTLKLDDLDRFLKVMGIGKAQTETVLRVAPSALEEIQTQVIVLEPQQ